MLRFYYLLFLIIFSFTGFSQGLFESSTTASSTNEARTSDIFSGYVRGSAFGLGEEYDYSYVFSELSLKTDVSRNNLTLRSDLRIRGGLKFNEEFTRIEIKEAFAGYSFGKLDARLGNQIVMWGRTDGFNPTNNINPSDFFFLSGNHDDQIMSNFMLRLRYRFTDRIDMDIIGIPFYKASVYRYDLFTMDQPARFQENILPERTMENSTFATRLNFEYPKISFSFSYFNGYNTFYGFENTLYDFGFADNIMDGFNLTIENAGKPHHKQTIGGDFEVPVNSWIIRGEVAYNQTEDYEDKMYIPNPDIYYVTGVERTFKGLTSILQYVGYYVMDFKELESPGDMPNMSDYNLFNPIDIFNFISDTEEYVDNMVDYELTKFNRKAFIHDKEWNHAIVLSLNRSFMYEILNAEFTAYYNISTEEKLFRPKITYKPVDNMEFSAGGFFMSGPDETIYDMSGKVLNGVFIELKANF